MALNIEFKQHLDEQLSFLKLSLENFPRNEVTAKQAATSVAILLHDPANPRKDSRTKSLLFTHMNQTNIKFLETKAPKGEMFGFHINPGKVQSKLQILTWEEITNLVSPYCGLVAKELIEVDGNIVLKYVPLFKYNNSLSNEVHAPMIDSFPWGFGKSKEVVTRGFVDFEAWWNSKIYEDDDGYSLTRKQLILNVRDTDGGSHIDDSLDENYLRIKKKDFLTMNINGQFQHFHNIPAYSSVIQIAWETFVSIKKQLESSTNTQSSSPPRSRIVGNREGLLTPLYPSASLASVLAFLLTTVRLSSRPKPCHLLMFRVVNSYIRDFHSLDFFLIKKNYIFHSGHTPIIFTIFLTAIFFIFLFGKKTVNKTL